MQTLKLPKGGKAMEEGTVVEWTVDVGDAVSEGEPVVLFETDKMVSEIAAAEDGVLLERLVDEGETVAVGTVLGHVGQEGETPAADADSTADESAGDDAEPAADDADADADTESGPGPQPVDSPPADPGTYRATPSARRAARERGVDIEAVAAVVDGNQLTPSHVEAFVAGGGRADAPADDEMSTAPAGSFSADDVAVEPVANPAESPVLGSPWARVLASNHGVSLDAIGGERATERVSAADVEAYVEQHASEAAQAEPATTTDDATAAEADTASESTGYGDAPAVRREDPIQGARAVMFERMSSVTSEYASTTTVQRVDVTDLLDLYDRLSSVWDEEASLSLTAFVVRAVAQTLPDYEMLNAEVTDDEHLRVYDDVNVGLAVNADDGLLVPTIYGADDRSVRDLSAEIERVADGARNRSLNHDDLQNGTFTVSNAGSLGAYINTPQINPPQTAILGMCTIFDQPGVVDGDVVPRKMMHLCLTYDHRVVEGADAVGFLRTVTSLLESPESLLS